MCAVYLMVLGAVSIAGMALGYPEALWVWVLPFLTGCRDGDAAETDSVEKGENQ